MAKLITTTMTAYFINLNLLKKQQDPWKFFPWKTPAVYIFSKPKALQFSQTQDGKFHFQKVQASEMGIKTTRSWYCFRHNAGYGDVGNMDTIPSGISSIQAQTKMYEASNHGGKSPQRHFAIYRMASRAQSSPNLKVICNASSIGACNSHSFRCPCRSTATKRIPANLRSHLLTSLLPLCGFYRA